MDASGSFLKTVIWRIRAAIDLPNVDTRWNNDNLVRHVIQPAFTNIWSKVNLSSSNYIVMKHTITVESDTEFYQLPPNVGNVLSFRQIDSSTGLEISDLIPLSVHNPNGSGWRLEGNLLTLDPVPTLIDDLTFQIRYVPTGDTIMHYADGSSEASRGTLSEDADGVLNTLTLCTTPTEGELERRPNGLVGMIVRILKKSDNSVLRREEHVIATHNVTTGVITTRTPIVGYADTNTVAYEVAPLYHDSLYNAVADYATWSLSVSIGESGPRQSGFFGRYKDSLKSFRDNMANLQSRTGMNFAIDTLDNPNYG